MKYNSTLPEGNGTPLQYSCLENPMDWGAWWAAVHGVAESWTRLSDFTFTFHFHALEKEMATHSSVLAWRIPGMGEPDGLPSIGSHRVGHDWSDLATAAAVEKYIKMFGKSIVLQGICSYSLKKKCIYVFIETFLTVNKEKFNLIGWIYTFINKMERYIEMKTNESYMYQGRYTDLYTIRKWILLHIS